MGKGISEVLPSAIGVAISPVPIIAVILMLFSRRADVRAGNAEMDGGRRRVHATEGVWSRGAAGRGQPQEPTPHDRRRDRTRPARALDSRRLAAAKLRAATNTTPTTRTRPRMLQAPEDPLSAVQSA